MDESRRDFLKGLGLVAGAGMLGLPLAGRSFAQPPGSVGVRRNVMDLDPDGPELRAYRRAVQVLRSLAPSDRRSWYGQAEIHLQHCPHGNWYFLPWHRAYLAAFERLCRAASGDPGFMLPYWDWTTQRSLPPPFWQPPLADCNREVGPDDELDDELVGQQVITDILGTGDFVLFASAVAHRDCDPQQPMEQRAGCGSGILEGTPHNGVHRFIGGDMGTFLSPLDPVFWLHHANVDRLWTEWNRGHANTDDPRWLDFEFAGNFVDAASQPVDFRVSDTLSTFDLGYRYDTQPLTASVQEPGPLREGELLAQAANQEEVFLGGTLSLSLPVTDALRAAVGAGAALAAPAGDLRLSLAGIEVPDEPVLVRVFVELPSAGPETPVSDPHFAGSFTFFEHVGLAASPFAAADGGDAAHHHGGGERTFLRNLAPALARLREAGELDLGEALTVQLVPVMLPGRERATASLPRPIQPDELRLTLVE